MILALALSLALTLIVLALDNELRERLGQTYWIIGLAIIGSILLVLTGYVWDRTLVERLRQINETARPPTPGVLDPAPAEPSPAEGLEHDEIISLARKIEAMAKALQKVEASYRGIVEDQIDLICRYRADGTLTFVNGAMERFFGRSRQELIGQPLPLPHDRLLPADERGRRPAMATVEVDLVSDAGVTATYLWTHRAITAPNGEVLEYQGVGHNITDRKAAEATLRQAKEAAESADRAKTEFLAIVSHEIRTPINGVVGFTKLLRETELTPDQREYVDLIHNSGAALEALIADILDLSKIEAGRIDLANNPFPLRDSVLEVQARFAPRARATGVVFEVRIDPGVPAIVTGDQHRLRQILLNLVDNAFKFTESGSITVTLTCIRGDDIPGTDRRRLRLFFAIADTGIGIPANRLPELFKPFNQVDSSSTRRRGGTGLGLVIAKRLCELMGGAISVESRLGEGSTFRFSVALDYQKGDSLPPFPMTAASAPRPPLPSKAA